MEQRVVRQRQEEPAATGGVRQARGRTLIQRVSAKINREKREPQCEHRRQVRRPILDPIVPAIAEQKRAQKKLKKFVHDSMLLETSKFIKLIYC